MVSFKGMSWLTAVLREVGADVALTDYKTTHVQNGATPGLVLKYPRNLSEKALDSLKKRFAALYAGPGNAGKTLVLDEGADVTVAGSTLEQLQFTAVQSAGVERIAAAAMVPLEVLGLVVGGAGHVSGRDAPVRGPVGPPGVAGDLRVAAAPAPGRDPPDPPVVRRFRYRGAP